MNRKNFFGKAFQLFFLSLLFSLIANAAWSISGREIMEKNDSLPEGNSSSAYSYLFIFKGGCQSTQCAIRKEFEIQSKKYGKNRSRSLISFVKPTRLKFLTWSQSGDDSQQWIKPSRSGVRKIASADKGNSFVNSHFYYEDLSDRDIDDYRYRNIGSASVDGQECYKVESKKIKASKVYNKLHLYVRKSDFVIVRVDFFENGRHSKTLYNQKIKKIQGIHTPQKAIMVRTDGKGKTILYVTKVKYNIPVSDTKLKPNAM